MNRRCFLRQLEGASAAAVAGALGLPLGGCIGFHYVAATVAGSSVLVQRRDFGNGRFVLVDVPGLVLPLYVYRHDDGTYTTVSTRCMHQGCQVEPVAGHLVCPCHGSEYTNSGEILKGPTPLPLQRFRTHPEGDVVVIELADATRGGTGAGGQE